MQEKETKKIIGLMSGTSCDSIDAGLCEVYPDLTVKLIKGINYPYPEHIRTKIFHLRLVITNIILKCYFIFFLNKSSLLKGFHL